MNELDQKIFKRLAFLEEDLHQAFQVSFDYWERSKILELYSALLSYQHILTLKGNKS